MKTLKNKSIYRVIMMGTGLVEFLSFLLIPFIQAADAFGFEGLMNEFDAISGNGLTLINKLASGKDDTVIILVLALIPAVLGLGVSLLHLIGKGKVSYIFSIVFEVVAIMDLGVTMACCSEAFRSTGGVYHYGPGFWMLLLGTLTGLVTAIIGMIKEKKATASAIAEMKKTAPAIAEMKKTASAVIEKKKNVAAEEPDTIALKENVVVKKEGGLKAMSGSYSSAVFPIEDGQTVIIGRDPGACHIVIREDIISRKHCLVTYHTDNHSYSITDTSSNGVFDKQGRRLPAYATVVMNSGDEIRIGRSNEIFRLA